MIKHNNIAKEIVQKKEIIKIEPSRVIGDNLSFHKK
jgi:hypothetical protein